MKKLYFSLTVVVLFCCSCNTLFYLPKKDNIDPVFGFDEVVIRENPKVYAWVRHSKKIAKGTIVFFHGNAGNLENHYSQLDWVPDNFNIIALDYQGYGKSEGSPSQTTIMNDCKATIEKAFKLFSNDNIIIFGQSLGGNAAMMCIDDENIKYIKAVILEGTFPSYKKIAAKFAGSFLANILISEIVNPLENMQKYVNRLSFFVIHAQNDPVIPLDQGILIAKSLGCYPQNFLLVCSDKHLNTFDLFSSSYDIYRDKVINFIENSIGK